MGARTGFASWRWGSMALAFGMAASCSKNQPTAAAQTKAPLLQPTVAAAPPPAEGQHGAGKKGGGFKESAVYVDGVAKGILRYSELPASAKPVAMPEIDELPDVARYYRLSEYLRGIGVDLQKIQEVQIYGSHDRIAIVTGDEIRTLGDRLVFDFSRQTSGKPRARWSQLHTLAHRAMIDVIQNISIYITKTPPTLAHGDMWIDGRPVEEGIPYVGDGIPKGTRVYADGKLDGWVRRKQLPSKVVAPGSEPGQTRFSTDAFLAYVGADARNLKAIDFYDGDDLLARVDGKTWAQTKGDYVFELPTRSHGQVKEFFPGDKSARVTSIQLYVRSTPPARQADPAVFEQQGGSDDPQSGGSGDGNGGGSGGNNGVTPTAQGVNNAQSTADDDQF